MKRIIKNRLLGAIQVFLVVILLPIQFAQAENITFNFNNADIHMVIKFVSSFSGKNFLVDNRVKGRVTLISPKPIPSDQAYDVFLSVLDINGFSAVESGQIIKILPKAAGKQGGAPIWQKNATSDSLATQIIHLKYTKASTVLPLVRPLIAPSSSLTAYLPGNLLILTDTRRNIANIQKLIALVDNKRNLGVKIFTLKHTSADVLAKTIIALYKNQTMITVLAQQPENKLIISAPPQTIRELTSVVKNLDAEPESNAGRIHVRYLKHAKAEEAAKVLTELLGTASSSDTSAGKKLFTGSVKVVADPTTNALLITAGHGDMKSINHILDKLDIPRLQVLIEALIVEVSGTSGEKLGIEWLASKDFRNGGASVLGGQTYGSISTIATAAAAAPVAGGALAVAGALPDGLTLGVFKGSLAAGNISLGALLTAIKTHGDANVLSTPSVLVMDNEEAEFIVGQNVPFVTGSNSTQGGIANPFQTIQRKDIGLTLRVTPQISEGNTVRLAIYQEVSSISKNATLAGAASDIITNKRSIKSVALSQDGEILVLGGLMRNDINSSVRMVPCIGAMPIIGEAFRFNDSSIRKTNLMVFIRSRIVRNAGDMKVITQEKYFDIKSLYEAPTSNRSIFFPEVKKELPENLAPSTLDMIEHPVLGRVPAPTMPLPPSLPKKVLNNP